MITYLHIFACFSIWLCRRKETDCAVISASTKNRKLVTHLNVRSQIVVIILPCTMLHWHVAAGHICSCVWLDYVEVVS